MARLKDIAERTSDIFHIHPAKIQIDPAYNPEDRKFDPINDPADAADLASIREIGIQTPLMVRPSNDGEHVILVRGHRRLAAVNILMAEGLEFSSVPCQPEPRGRSAEDRELDLIISNRNKPLSALSTSTRMRNLLSYGWSEADIAKKTGYSPQHVRNLLDLSTAPVAVRNMVRDETVSATTAISTLRTHGDDASATLQAALDANLLKGKAKVTQRDIPAASKPKEPCAVALPPPPTGELTPRESRYLEALQRIYGCCSVAGAKEYARIALIEPGLTVQV